MHVCVCVCVCMCVHARTPLSFSLFLFLCVCPDHTTLHTHVQRRDRDYIERVNERERDKYNSSSDHNYYYRYIYNTVGTWLILPVVICLSQRLSHACLSISLFIQRDCGWLIKSVIVYLMVSFFFSFTYLDNRGNSRANTCARSLARGGRGVKNPDRPHARRDVFIRLKTSIQTEFTGDS